MPDLPIGGPEDAAHDPPKILAVMTYPRSAQERNRFLGRVRERVAGEMESKIRERKRPHLKPEYATLISGVWLADLLAPLGGFAELTEAPSYEETWKRAGSRAWPGAISGDILINLLQLQAAGIDHSLNKALAIEVFFLADAKTGLDEPPPGKTERYIRDAWRDFKPACHLWATFRAWEIQEYPEWFSLFTSEGLPQFLSLSQGVLARAAGLRARGEGKPLIDVDQAWRVPLDYRLPPTGFRVPPLEDWKLEALRRKFKSLRP